MRYRSGVVPLCCFIPAVKEAFKLTNHLILWIVIGLLRYQAALGELLDGVDPLLLAFSGSRPSL